MEGHVSNKYARYITSSPFAFSPKGLESKLKLLVMQANHTELTFDGYLEMKYGKNTYKEIVKNMKEITNKKVKINLIKKENKNYDLTNQIANIIDPICNNNINNLLRYNKAKMIY